MYNFYHWNQFYGNIKKYDILILMDTDIYVIIVLYISLIIIFLLHRPKRKMIQTIVINRIFYNYAL